MVFKEPPAKPVSELVGKTMKWRDIDFKIVSVSGVRRFNFRVPHVDQADQVALRAQEPRGIEPRDVLETVVGSASRWNGMAKPLRRNSILQEDLGTLASDLAFYGTLCTEANCERVFKFSGMALSPLRTRLGPIILQAFVFVAHNEEFFSITDDELYEQYQALGSKPAYDAAELGAIDEADAEDSDGADACIFLSWGRGRDAR